MEAARWFSGKAIQRKIGGKRIGDVFPIRAFVSARERIESKTLGQGDSGTPCPVELEGLFRRRLKELIQRKYRSLDRFYLETDFSKGHLSNILRGNGSPTVTTLAKLAKALDIEVNELFVFPERGPRDRAIDLVHGAKPELIRRMIRLLTEEANKSQ